MWRSWRRCGACASRRLRCRAPPTERDLRKLLLTCDDRRRVARSWLLVRTARIRSRACSQDPRLPRATAKPACAALSTIKCLVQCRNAARAGAGSNFRPTQACRTGGTPDRMERGRSNQCCQGRISLIKRTLRAFAESSSGCSLGRDGNGMEGRDEKPLPRRRPTWLSTLDSWE